MRLLKRRAISREIFDVRGLISAYGNGVRPVDNDIGRLQHGITEETRRDTCSSFSPTCVRFSLNVGTRSNQPSGVIMERSRCSSACSLTSDWRKIAHFFGI